MKNLGTFQDDGQIPPHIKAASEGVENSEVDGNQVDSEAMDDDEDDLDEQDFDNGSDEEVPKADENSVVWLEDKVV